MIRIPKDRPPTHPGEMLLTEFLEPLGLTQKQLASSIHVPYQRINEIINGKRGLIKLSKDVTIPAGLQNRA
jgi:antitoxin HigA-1